jgi:hypothetical protein
MQTARVSTLACQGSNAVSGFNTDCHDSHMDCQGLIQSKSQGSHTDYQGSRVPTQTARVPVLSHKVSQFHADELSRL